MREGAQVGFFHIGLLRLNSLDLLDLIYCRLRMIESSFGGLHLYKH